MMDQFIFTDIKKSLCGYNQKQVDSRAKFLYNYYNKLQNNYNDLMEKYNVINTSLQEKVLELYNSKKEIETLKIELNKLKQNQNISIDDKESIKSNDNYSTGIVQFTQEDLNNQDATIVNDNTFINSPIIEESNDIVFTGDVEDNKSNKFLIDNNETNEGFVFMEDL